MNPKNISKKKPIKLSKEKQLQKEVKELKQKLTAETNRANNNSATYFKTRDELSQLKEDFSHYRYNTEREIGNCREIREQLAYTRGALNWYRECHKKELGIEEQTVQEQRIEITEPFGQR